MELEFIYKQLDERLTNIDFAGLFNGFHRFPFALYNDEELFAKMKVLNGDFVVQVNDDFCMKKVWQK